MIMVDTSVWIDYFNGRNTPETEILDGALGDMEVAVGDIILTEVLQGFRSDKEYRTARADLLSLDQVGMLGMDIALKASENYRTLRKKGITVRKTVDVIIATFCIEHDLPLLFSDRDFMPLVKHLGLTAVIT